MSVFLLVVNWTRDLSSILVEKDNNFFLVGHELSLVFVLFQLYFELGSFSLCAELGLNLVKFVGFFN